MVGPDEPDDPRILAFFQEMNLPEPLSQLAEGPIFVVGQPRSGTTWVYDILTAHPDATGVLESWLFTPEHGLAGPASTAHWDAEKVERYTALTGGPLGLNQLVSRNEMISDVRELASRWLGRALKPHHRFLVEKSPPHLASVAFIAEVFPEARFVNVLRDGRDVVVSTRAAARSWNPAWRHRREGSVYNAAQMWRHAVAMSRELGSTLGERYLEIRYEAIQEDRPGMVRRLFDFCGMPCDDALLDRVLSETDFTARFAGGEDRFRRAGRVGQWRERFGLLDGLAFELAAGRTLRETGYASTRTWWLRRPLRRTGRS